LILSNLNYGMCILSDYLSQTINSRVSGMFYQ